MGVNQEYADIISRLGPPLWWDECGVPRYDVFTPDMCNDIYADEACLLEIACQNCGDRFLVGMSWDRTDGILHKRPTLSERIVAGWIHYGDPPIHHCVGDTENCEDLQVIEFWSKDRKTWTGWKRESEFEIVLQEDADDR